MDGLTDNEYGRNWTELILRSDTSDGHRRLDGDIGLTRTDSDTGRTRTEPGGRRYRTDGDTGWTLSVGQIWWEHFFF